MIKRKKYTLIRYEDNVFGYIHRNVKKDERLALQAVLKEDGVFDVTDILFLNVKMLKKANKYLNDEGEVIVTIPFKDFEFNFYDCKKYEETHCYIYFPDTATFFFYSAIKRDPYLYNFLKKFIEKVNLTHYKMEDLK